MEIKTSNLGFKEQNVTALVMPVFKDEKLDDELVKNLDNSTRGLIASVLEAKEMTGKEGETVYLHLSGEGTDLKAPRLLLIGAGERQKYKSAQIAQTAGAAARTLRAKNVKSIGIMPRADHEMAGRAASDVVEGVVTALFEIDKYKTVDKEEDGEKRIDHLVVIVEGVDQGVLDCNAARGKIIGESVNYTRDLANEPSAYLTPTDLAEKATILAKECGLEVDILDETRMEKEGMGSLLCVGQGSEEPSKLIVLKYTPEDAGESGVDNRSRSNDLLAFIGKGVTFDTGGISIKPSEHMDQMKYDMTGGATVLGVMRAVSLLKATIPVLGVVPAVENMPSGKAVKPGDVVRAMNGKTIEVLNTDAEGRLILADALAYARKLGATRMVDLATLTGAVVIALGDVNVAILGTDQGLINDVIETGKNVGEKFWQLPLDEEYTKQIKSEIADIQNIGGRKAGTITAAAFLKEFVDDTKWAHLDIAGTAWADEAKPYRAKGPTGIAVRTLIALVEKESRDSDR